MSTAQHPSVFGSIPAPGPDAFPPDPDAAAPSGSGSGPGSGSGKNGSSSGSSAGSSGGGRKRPTTRSGRRAASAASKAAKSERPPKAKATPRRASLETRLTGSLITLGTMVAASGAVVSPALTQDGVLICQHAPNVAAALDRLAKDDPRIAQALERALTVGTWSGVVSALLPLVVGIAANHGAIPPNVAGLIGAATDPNQPDQHQPDQHQPGQHQPQPGQPQPGQPAGMPGLGIV